MPSSKTACGKRRSWNNLQQGNFINFCNGVARGTEKELRALERECGRFATKLTETAIPGIYEMDLKDFFEYYDGNLYLKEIIERYPGLKIVGFLEDWSPALSVWILYSESGYPYVTEGRFAGHFDNKHDDLWQLEHSPTENFTEQFVYLQSGLWDTVNYQFPYRQKWEDGNYYLLSDGQWYRIN